MSSLSLYLQWKRFGVFPFAGGIADQDPELTSDFELIDNIIIAERVRKAERDRRKKQRT